MARLCEELAAVLLTGEAPHDALLAPLLTSLPGVSCLNTALSGPGGQFVKVIPIMEAGTLRRGPPPKYPAGQDTATWRAFTHGKTLRGRDGVCSATKTQYRDWATLNQKYSAAAFVTVPLEVSGGVVGTLTAAGGPKMDVRAVQALAGRLAEVLLRRVVEGLLQNTAADLEAGVAAAEIAARIAASAPQAQPRTDGMPPALDLRCCGVLSEPQEQQSPRRSPSPRVGASPRSSGEGRNPGTPHTVGVSPFATIAAAASQDSASRRSSSDMRVSSFESYQELKYFCLACRAENCVDLPQWHWGQLVDHLAKGRRDSLSASTAPAMPSADTVSSTSHSIASAGLARMARLAAMCARNDDEEPLSTRVSSTTDLSHPVAQRAASGQLARISPRDLSDTSHSSSSSPANSRAGSTRASSSAYVDSSLRAYSGQFRGELPSPSGSAPSTPLSSRRPPLVPSTDDNPLRTQSADHSPAAHSAILAYTAGLRRRSATQGPSTEQIRSAAAAAAAKFSDAAAAGNDGAEGLRCVSDYIDNLRRKSQDLSAVNQALRRNSANGSPPSGGAAATDATPADAPTGVAAATAPNENLSTGALRAGSVHEDQTARDAFAAYRAARRNAPPFSAAAAAAAAALRQDSPPLPPAGHKAVAAAAAAVARDRQQQGPGVSRASTTRRVADKSAEGVAAARTMVDDYMASLQTRSMAATNSANRPPISGGPPRSDTPPADAAADGAKAAVDSYLADLRSRSLAARVARSTSPLPASSSGGSGDAAASSASPSAPPGAGGVDGRVTVDAYMSSLRKKSAMLGQARAGITAPAAAAATGVAASAAAVALPADVAVLDDRTSSNDAATAVTDYMKSLRRRSVAAAAAAAARQSSGQAPLEPPEDTPEAVAAAIAGARARSRPSPQPAAQEPQMDTTIPPQGQRDSAKMQEARAAVAAHMEALRQQSANLAQAQSYREFASSSSAKGRERRCSGADAQTSRHRGAPRRSSSDITPGSAKAAVDGDAAFRSSESAPQPAPASPSASGGSGGSATAVVDSYLESLRSKSRAIVSTQSSPNSSISARRSGSSVSGPEESPSSGARAAVDSYMDSLRQQSLALRASDSSCASSRDGGAAQSESLSPAAAAAANAQATVASYMDSLRQQSLVLAADRRARGASLDGASPQQQQQQPSAVASSADDNAQAAVDSHISSLRAQSAAFSGNVRSASRVAGAVGAAGPETQPAAAAAAAVAGNGTEAAAPNAGAAKAAVGTYMESLRRTSAALAGGSPVAATKPSVPSLRSGSLRSHSVRATSGSDSSGSDGKEDARAAVATYMENLKSRSVAAGGRRNQLAAAAAQAAEPAGISVRSSGSLRGGSLRLASIPLEPVGEEPTPEKDPRGGATASKEPEDPEEEAASKSEVEAHKVSAEPMPAD